MAHVNLLKQTLARNCRVLRDDSGDWHWNLYGPRFVRAGRRLERKANAAQTSGGRKKISLPRTRRSELRGLRFSLRFRLLAHLGEAPRLPAFINSMGGVELRGVSGAADSYGRWAAIQFKACRVPRAAGPAFVQANYSKSIWRCFGCAHRLSKVSRGALKARGVCRRSPRVGPPCEHAL
jgi:hypothetical protein